MIEITILGFDYALGSSIMGINDLFRLANASIPANQTERFKIQLASWDQRPIKTLNQIELSAHTAIQNCEHSDVYLIPTIAGDLDETLATNQLLIQWLNQLHTSECLIGSNSTGAFMLAEAGFLDGRTATTHWRFLERFQNDYPKVNTAPHQLLTHDGNLLCDGGGLAWLDLGLYLVELFAGHHVAVELAKAFVIDTIRPTQLSYSPLVSRKYHADKAVLAIQQWMDTHLAKSIVLKEVSSDFGLSYRSMIRRFNQATGMSPLQYLQSARLDAARKHLVQSNLSVDEITQAIGYEDVSSFTRLFKRHHRYTPSEFRARFKPIQTL